ncbi:hypothetical protein WICPIJ_007306 [Wickerhamomyces pijperi]|uniref:SPX domain-containing protein n=1 Tax=Wickerhamomyces pijperi TaxID=599730 RepID=A0A9P8Q2T4_WICPI|nr:hypothetical protein WICPIJ_007306 [Wickerhamomyces pijperi]
MSETSSAAKETSSNFNTTHTPLKPMKMLFGVRLSNEMYPAWKSHYMDYEKLKKLLKESTVGGEPYNDYDENQFVTKLDEELKKVYSFQSQEYEQLNTKIEELDKFIQDNLANSSIEWPKFQADLDNVLSEARELDHFARLNFTGFQKIIKKHDRLHPKYGSVRALLSLRLKELPFHSEDYSPLLYRISTLFQILRENFQSASYIHGSNSAKGTPLPGSSVAGIDPEAVSEFQSFKFWIHPDNLMEVKTRILRHLPVLVYSNEADNNDTVDPTITSLYFDNSHFEVYNNKLLKSNTSPSLRLRWSGKLSEKPEIFLEKKIVDKSLDENSKDIRLKVKEKYLTDFIVNHDVDEYKTKQLNKLKEMGTKETTVNAVASDIEDVAQFIESHDLEPTLRTVYTRTAFEIPGDDRVRITIDSDILFIREDSFDADRPIRDPKEWHRTDIDSNIANPYSLLRKNEFIKFPHSVMEIKIKNTSGRKGSEINGISIPFSRKHGKWIEDLTTSHLVKEVPNFSKFIQGVASLFLEDDRLDILPFWLPELEDDIRMNVNEADDEMKAKKKNHLDIASKMKRFSTNKRDQHQIQEIQPDNDSSDEEEVGNESTPLVPTNNLLVPKRQKNMKNEIIPFLIGGSKLANVDSEDEEVELPTGVKKPTTLLKQAGPVKIEAKVWLANERTFNRWLSVTTMFSVLTFAIYNSVKKSNAPGLADFLAYTYFALTLFCGVWGYYIFNKRLDLIKLRDGKHLDAPLGPLFVAFGVLLAVVVNFIVGFKKAQEAINVQEVHPLIAWVNQQMFDLVNKLI